MASVRPPTVEIETSNDQARRLWETALSLAWEFGEDTEWALIGGLMVQLHAAEYDGDSRLTDDVDFLGDAHRRPSMTQRIASTLRDRGAEMQTPPSSNERLGYKFDLDGQIVEILGPDGLESDPRTIGAFITFQTPGGSQALRRVEVVMVSLNGQRAVAVRRPSLLGAILIKARAVASERKEKFDSDRQDLVLLLSLIDDPRATATDGGLKKRERKWLRDVEGRLNIADPGLAILFTRDALTRAGLAFRLLTVE
jgi:hypothetical protein